MLKTELSVMLIPEDPEAELPSRIQVVTLHGGRLVGSALFSVPITAGSLELSVSEDFLALMEEPPAQSVGSSYDPN